MIRCISPQRRRYLFVNATTILLLLTLSDTTTAFSSSPKSNGNAARAASYRWSSGDTIAGKTTSSTVLSVSNNNEKNDNHQAITTKTTRRFWMERTTATIATILLLPSSAAWADYGQATKQAAPAVVPSPIRPTGEMAKICEVVALGREDICLVPLKLPSAYDRVLIDRAVEKIGDATGDGAKLTIITLLQSLAVADWATCEKELSQKVVEGVPNSTVKVLRKACQQKDAPVAIKTVLKLADKL